MITIAKHFTFDAAHNIPTMPDGHKCRRPHGHTYEVEIVCRGQIDTRAGFFIDYAMIAEAWEPFHERLDHRDLNEIPGLEVPTTENLAVWIFKTWHELVSDRSTNAQWCVWGYLDRIRIKESSTTWCEITKGDWTAFYGPNA